MVKMSTRQSLHLVPGETHPSQTKRQPSLKLETINDNRFSGPTVHFVSEEFDTGPILAQRVVPVYPKDTPKQLAARVLKEEHQVYPEAVAALVSGRIEWRQDGIPMITNYT